MPPEIVADADLDFSKAFDDLAALGDKKDDPNPFGAHQSDPPVTVIGETPPLEPVPADPAAVAETAVPAVEGEAAAVDPEPAPVVNDEDARLARFAKIIKDEIVQPKPAEAPVAPAAPEPATPLYTEDEQKTIAAYLKEWPDVAKADALIRRAEYVQLDQYFQQRLQQVIQPIAQIVQTLSERTQLSDLRSEVTDYDDIHGKVVEWVGKQPSYLRPAYENVVKSGTPAEVVDLINRYRADTGAAAPAAPAAAAPKPAAQKPVAVRQAAAALAPVASKMGSPPQAEPTTFEDAFTAFAAKL